MDDVQRILTEGKGKSDAAVARQLSGLELTERMSSAKLTSLEQSVPGTRSRRALVALADASVFLSPTAADVLSEASPDSNERHHMLDLTVAYLVRTLYKLPDFYATRTIVRFEGRPLGTPARAGFKNDSPWRRVGSSRVVVAYRDGQEVIDPREWGKHSSHPEDEGMITRGTFGPILSVVIRDAAHSGFTWNRWERGSAGALAVFRYRVPQDQSHYSVGTHGSFIDIGNAAQVTGYHGEMAIDPATGTILRLTVQAEQPLDSSILRRDIMVEYGPVEIGGRTYTCPIRSVSIGLDSTEFMGAYLGQSTSTAEATLLNDTTFENYHQFRSESRILPGYIPAP